jgi:hypothetical protein
MMVKTKRKINNRQKSRRVKTKGGSGGTKGLIPIKYCSRFPETMPVCPSEPLITNTAPFAKPWLNVNSNLLFIGLVISEHSALGYKIRELNFALGKEDPYGVSMEETGSKLALPHITLMNIYIPELSEYSIHNMLMQDGNFSYIANTITSIIQQNIVKVPYKKLRSQNNIYEHFGNFVVKKYTDNSQGDFDNFINDRFLPFKTDIINSLLGLLPSCQDTVGVQSCCPAYFPRNKASQIFRHYSVDPEPNVSNFAISKYFEEDLSPHISLYNSPDKQDRDMFISNAKTMATNDLDELELSPCGISSVFVSYNGAWVNTPL